MGANCSCVPGLLPDQEISIITMIVVVVGSVGTPEQTVA